VRILVAEGEGFSPRALVALEALGDVRVGDLDRPGLAAAVHDVDVVFVRLRNRVDGALLDGAPALRAVVRPTTGLDHLDLEALDARGVAVLSLRGETDFLRTVTATAEHTWALLLALVRRIPAATAAAAAGDWDRDRFRGRELAGKSLGLVGLGRLGSMVARYGAAFGMRVRAFDPYRGEAWPDGVEPCATLEELLRMSDVVSLHVPLGPDTEGLLGADQFRAMRPGAVLVNTSRGRIVDEEALVQALATGRLAGAALDVVAGEGEPEGAAGSPAVRYARDHDQLLITPHVGGATLESMENTEIFMAGKLARWLRGEEVRVDAGPASAPSPHDSTAQ
jgi:D-3-phosphoglycerate dehydrogenase